MTLLDRGDWITTYTGKFFPNDPQENEINIETIAHALSNLCRFGGHINEFYSVAQHCVLCSYVAPKEYKLEALLHDASEAYLVDIPRPIKQMLPDYKSIELKVEKVIASKFNLPFPISFIVKDIDNRMLVTEASALLNGLDNPWWLDSRYPKIYSQDQIKIDPWSPKLAEEIFMDAYNEYTR
jgi:hypothetical protein